LEEFRGDGVAGKAGLGRARLCDDLPELREAWLFWGESKSSIMSVGNGPAIDIFKQMNEEASFRHILTCSPAVIFAE
jgi:hypothetical protein